MLDPEKVRAKHIKYNASEKGKARRERYRSTTKYWLAEERHYQARMHGGTHGLED